MNRIVSLALTMAKIGLIGFGGGNALVPVIEKELVTTSQLLTKEEFDKEVIVANITPGALPIEIASGAGRVIAGAPGMVIAALSMALPGALFTFALLVLFTTAASSVMEQVRFASVGIAMLIAMLLLNYAVGAVRAKAPHSHERIVSLALVIGVFALTCGKKLFSLLGLSTSGVITLSTLDVLGIVFFAIFFTGGRFSGTTKRLVKTGIAALISVLYLLSTNLGGPLPDGMTPVVMRVIMFALGFWGFVVSFRKENGPKRAFPVKRMLFESFIWVAFVAVLAIPGIILCPEGLQFVSSAILSVLMSFGGGDAYLVFGQGLFVDTGMIPSDLYFEQVVTVSNAMPGSIIAKVLTGVGFLIGSNHGPISAVVMAIAGLGCGVGASGLTFLIMYYVYERFEPLGVFRAIKRYIRPVIGGLLLTIAVTMLSLNMNVASTFGFDPLFMVIFSFLLLAVMFWASNVKSCPLSLLIVIAIVLSLLVCNVVHFAF